MSTDAWRERKRAYKRRRVAEWREAGICVQCGSQPAKADRKSCEACLAKMRENAARLRERRRAAGVCRLCETPVTDGMVHCPDCRGDMNAAKRAMRLR